MKTEAQYLLDAGNTPAQMAGIMGIGLDIAEAIAQQYTAPRWPTLTPEQLAALPDDLRRIVESNNPNHRKATP